MRMKRIFLTLIFIAVLQINFAQPYQISFSTDSTEIVIGDHLHVTMNFSVPKEAVVPVPIINQELLSQQNPPIDWIENSKIDTQFLNNKIQYQQTITVTAFDSGSYQFPTISIIDQDSMVLAQSQPLYFNVTTFPVDTTAAFKDNKGNVNTPFTLHEFWLYAKKYYPFILLGMAIMGIVIYLIIRYQKRKKKTKTVIAKPKPKVKADVKAIKALQRLRQKKLWEQGKVKGYYSELTDILRIYMEDRWEVYAMEMVTTEILDELKQLDIESSTISSIRKTLELSDLVKFAKCDPLPDEHDAAFKSIQNFVEKTKVTTNSNQK